MATSFDPNTFLHQTFDETNDTKRMPVPVGEYLAICEKVDVKPWSSKDGSSSGVKLEAVWDIQDEAAKSLLARDKVTCRQQIMLDLTDGGQLDMGKGKNIGLGRLREATGLNTPGQPFSFAMFQGQMAKIFVGHRPDPKDPEILYDEVNRVAKP